MILTNVNIVTPKGVIKNGSVIIKDKNIDKILNTSVASGIDCKGMRMFPGFIDMHVHGTNDADFMDATEDAINTIVHALPKEGTTSLLATTMTESLDKIEHAIRVLKKHTNETGTKILGIHLEGPFINADYVGAQNTKHIITGSKEIFKRLNTASNQKIRVITLAPEVQTRSFLDYLSKEDVILSMGHSNATHNDVLEAMKYGIKRVTHCYNAMRQCHHRDIGLTGSALLYDDITIELIADLVHVSEPALKLAYKNKHEAIHLITDSIRAKHMPDGNYQLGGQPITVKNSIPYTQNGTLAGSTLTLNRAAKTMQNCIKIDDVSLANMLATSQAHALGIADKLGSIQEKLIADLVLVDASFNVAMTIIDGLVVYRNESLV